LKEPVISVGMPVYNGEQYISEALESILGQSIRDFELIISDNASTDSTPEICRKYSRLDSRIVYIRQKRNIGGPRNWNFVFKQSRGKYFKWASANDVCHPRMLEICKKVLDERKDVVLSYPKTRMIDSKGIIGDKYEDGLDLQEDVAAKRFKKLLIKIDLNNAQNGLIRSKSLKRTALEGVYQNGDLTLMAELALYGKFVEIPEFMFFRRVAPGAVTSQRSGHERRIFNVPDFQGWLYLPMLQLYFDLFAAVFRSQINKREKLDLYYFLGKKVNWDRRAILEEFLHSLRFIGTRYAQNRLR